MSTKPRRRSAITALFAAAIALLLVLPSFASADPLGETTIYKSGLQSQPLIHNVTAGPDGNVWFTDFPRGIGRITPSGEIEEFIYEENLVFNGTGLGEEPAISAITTGPEGKLWFTDFDEEGPAIGVLDPAEPEEANEYLIEAEGGNAESKPQGIVAGADGNLYFADVSEEGPAIGRINPITHVVKEFPVGEGSKPQGIVAGPDGNIWFTDTGETRAIGKFDLGTETIEEFSTGENSEPGGGNGFFGTWGIAAGPDGNVWFTENGSNTEGEGRSATGKAIGRITPSGEIKYFSEGLIASSKPLGITSAPGGKLWFTDSSGINETQELVIEAAASLGGTYKLGFEGKETGVSGKGNLTSGSKEITSVSATSGVFVKGEEISGEGIPAGTFIEKCSNGNTCGAGVTKVFLTQAATETKSSVTLTANLSATSNTNNTNNTIRQAFESLSTVGASNVSIAGTGFTSLEKRTITFVGSLQATDVAQTTCNGAGLTGTSPSCAVTTTVTSVPNAVGSITTAGKIVRYPREQLHSTTDGITRNGSEGNVWFTSGTSSLEKLAKFGIEPTNHRTLTLTKSAGGSGGIGSVSSKPKGINCAAACNSAVASMYANSTVVLTAKPSNGSTFTGWTGDCSGAGTTCTVEMSAPKSVEAVFGTTSKAIINPQALTLSKGESSGYGTVKAAGLACEAECTETTVLYQGPVTLPKPKPGKTVELKATAAFGSVFSGWSGSGCSGTGTCLVTMEEAKSVTATFTVKPDVRLTLNKNAYAEGTGTVSSKPKGINCAATCTTQAAAIPQGESVLLTAKPATGMTFVKWEGGDCEGIAITTCTVTMNNEETITAKFSGSPKAIAEAKKLTLTNTGSGFGTVKAAGLTCEVLCITATSLYAGPVTLPKPKAGATVTLKATSAPGSKPVVWGGSPCKSNPTPGECVVEMSADKSVTATFDELP